MNTRRYTSWALCTLLIFGLVGCASAPAAPPPPTDEELVTTLVNNTLAALQAKDIDTMLSVYSDDFQSDQGQDKTATEQFLKAVNEQGFLDGIELDTSAMTVAVDGDAATVEGVGLTGAFGVLTLGFGLEKRDGSWLVTSQTQQQ